MEEGLKAAPAEDDGEGELAIWDEIVMAGVNGDTGMTADGIFVREYVRTGDAMLACNRAGLQDARFPLSIMAERHLARPEIQAAIEIARELQRDEQAVPVVYTRELLLDDMQRTYEKAMEEGVYAPAITAKKLQAQLLGMLDQTININHGVSVSDLPLDELRRLVRERMPGDGAKKVTVIDG